jgi:hypothetical protein
VWIGGSLLFALTKRDIRSSVGGLLKLVFTSFFLGGVILAAVAYATVTVLALRQLGYWERDMTRVALLWFIGFALVALFSTKNVDTSYYRHLVLHNLGLAVVVEFVANLYTFPLPVELVLVPMAFLLAGTQAYAAIKPQFAAVRKVTASSLSVLGLLSLAYSISYVINNFEAVATAEKIKEFALPLVLTICFVPFLVGVRYFTVWQTMLHMIRFGLRDNDRLYRFTRRAIIRTCGPHLGKAQLFESEFRGRLLGAASKRDVSKVIDEFSKEWATRRRVRGQQDHRRDAPPADLASVTEELDRLMYEKGEGDTARALTGDELDIFVGEQSLRTGASKQAVYDYIAAWATAKAYSLEASLAQLDAEDYGQP